MKEKVKTPIEYKMERGVTTMKPKGDEFIWNSSTICQILRNEMYVGNLVYDKYETPTVGGKAHLKPRSEWKHIRIIMNPLYSEKYLNPFKKPVEDTRKEREKVSHPLIGKVRCGALWKDIKD